METTTKTSKVDELGSDETRAISPEEYRRVLSGLKLAGLSLTHCEAQADRLAAEQAFAQPNSVPVHITGEVSFETTEKAVIVNQTYKITGKQGRRRVFALSATYAVAFQSTEPFTEQFFKVFKDRTLPTFTWPYLRELVSSMTSRMGLPELVLSIWFRPTAD